MAFLTQHGLYTNCIVNSDGLYIPYTKCIVNSHGLYILCTKCIVNSNGLFIIIVLSTQIAYKYYTLSV